MNNEIDESKIVWLEFELTFETAQRRLSESEVKRENVPLVPEDIIPEFDYKKIGEDFKLYREQSLLSNEKLAELFNVSQPLIYRISNGERLSYRTVVKVCNVLNKDINGYITNGAIVDAEGAEFSRKLGQLLRERLKTTTLEKMAGEIGIGKVVLERIAHSQSEQYPYQSAIAKTLKYLGMTFEDINRL